MKTSAELRARLATDTEALNAAMRELSALYFQMDAVRARVAGLDGRFGRLDTTRKQIAEVERKEADEAAPEWRRVVIGGEPCVIDSIGPKQIRVRRVGCERVAIHDRVTGAPNYGPAIPDVVAVVGRFLAGQPRT